MSGLAVELYHADAAVGAANRLPVTAEVVGSVAVTGSLVNGASTAFIGRTGALALTATGSVAPAAASLVWPAGRCFAGGTPAVIGFDFTATYASRAVAITGVRLVATRGGVSALHAGLLLANAAFTAAADGALPAVTALQAASGVSAIECRNIIQGATLNLCQWSGRHPITLDSDGNLYGQVFAVQDWTADSATELVIHATIHAEVL